MYSGFHILYYQVINFEARKQALNEIWGETSITSSVFVYTKVLADNLNDIKDTAFLIG